MIKHFVCIKLKDSGSDSKKAAADVILSMRGKVPSAMEVDVFTDFLCSPRSYDLLLQVLVNDRDALDEYQNDTYHCGTVKAYLAEHASSTVTIDSEI